MEDDGDPSALSIEVARARVLDSLSTIVGSERLPTREARGRVLAADIAAPMSVPRFRASAMDGYALRHAERDRVLTVVGRSLAGHPGDDRLEPGGCVRITTGARVPDEADTVVQQENVALEGDRVRLLEKPERGLNVRAVGSDSESGTTLLGRDTRLAAAELALLAAHGIVEVDVRRPLRLGLFSTGDELVEPGTALGRGQIHDANRALLHALLDEPAIEIDDLGICPDSPRALDELMERSASADLLVSSGGVSVGEADHVRAALEKRGHVSLWKIAMKPGRPLTFGTLEDGRVFFGLPGNPVSAAITALMFVRPAIARLTGTPHEPLPPLDARLESALRKRPGRVEYQRGCLRVDESGKASVTTTGLQDSHVLRSLQRANCLIELPIASSGAEAGETVAVHPFRSFAHPPL